MKSYPSIDKKTKGDLFYYGFDKLDGSNIRAEWDKKKGFWKFGTRHRLLSAEETPFGEAVGLVQETYSESLSKIFVDNRWQKVICFWEFLGDSSFAGSHFDEKHRVVLLDVNSYKKGFLPPKDFIKKFESTGIPNVVHRGNVNQPVLDSVKDGTLEGVSDEGVVFKGVRKNQIVMFKTKSTAWLDRLRNYCAGDEVLFNRLS